VFAPSRAAFAESGRVLAALAARQGWQLVEEKASLLNDALIAQSCREQWNFSEGLGARRCEELGRVVHTRGRPAGANADP
jgi:hypothetical protein